MRTMPYRELDHTADLAFEISGQTLDELFAEGARALMGVLVRHPEAIRPERSRRIELEEETLEDLFHRFLSEFIFWMDAYGEVYLPEEVRVEEREGTWRLRGVVRGEPFDPERHGMHHHVKSVTYHDLQVRATPDGYRAFVILDV